MRPRISEKFRDAPTPPCGDTCDVGRRHRQPPLLRSAATLKTVSNSLGTSTRGEHRHRRRHDEHLVGRSRLRHRHPRVTAAAPRFHRLFALPWNDLIRAEAAATIARRIRRLRCLGGIDPSEGYAFWGMVRFALLSVNEFPLRSAPSDLVVTLIGNAADRRPASAAFRKEPFTRHHRTWDVVPSPPTMIRPVKVTTR
jgi:hypothetical protein